jgi:PAS domain S-box-containing protein
MGALMRAHAWTATPVGAPEDWPQALKTTVRLMLTSQHPMFIWWGEALTCFYNDAYSALIGPDRHPGSLGRPGREVWAEIWEVIGPQIEFVMAGRGATWHERQLIPITRGDAVEDVWWTYGYSPIDDDGSITGVGGVLVICRDVTAEVRAEQGHAAEADRLRQLFEQAPGFMALLRGSTHIFDLANAAFLRLVGRPVLGKPILEAMPEIGGQDLFERLDQVYASGDALTASRAPLTIASGANGELERRFVDIVFQPVHDATGAVSGIFIEGSDVTRAKLSEDALLELNASLEQRVAQRTEEYDRVWRNSRDLLVIVGTDGIVHAVNPAWTRTLGHDRDEVTGHGFAEFLWSDPAPATQGRPDEALWNRDLTNFENRCRHKDGTPRLISWHTSVQGDLVYAYGRDITGEKEQEEALARAEDQLRQAQKMEAVGQLTGGIAHDFNNLLTGIMGALELMQQRVEAGRTGELTRYIGIATVAAKRAAALTQRLLAFARRQPLDPRPVDANRLIASMAEMLPRTLGPSIRLEIVSAADLWVARCDPNQLENAILNLAINARDAMPEGGRLTVETANAHLDEAYCRLQGGEVRPGQYVAVCVTDTGVGMPPEVVARVFEPFYTTKPTGQGTGLGLSMLYGFVKQSGGHVRVYSEPGKGTTIRLYLPRHRGGAFEEAADPVPLERAVNPAGGTVLVVEDEAAIRALIGEALGDIGCRVLEAADGPAGLRLLQSGVRVDLLLTDVGLPGGLNGRQLADAAREFQPALPVLFVTGYAHNAAVGNGPALDPGMEMLTKPFALDALVAKVRDMIGKVPRG